MAVRIVWLLTV